MIVCFRKETTILLLKLGSIHTVRTATGCVFNSTLLRLRCGILVLHEIHEITSLQEQSYLWRFDFKIKERRRGSPDFKNEDLARISRKEKPPAWSLRKTVTRVNFLLVFLCVSSSFLTKATNLMSEREKDGTRCSFTVDATFFSSEMRWVWLSSDRYGVFEVFWSL